VKITRLKAIEWFNALSMLEQSPTTGPNGKPVPYDLPAEQFVLVWQMLNALRPHVEAFQKAREARMKVLAEKTEAERAAEITNEVAMLQEEFSVRMPKKRLDLDIGRTKIMPSLLIALEGLWNKPEVELEDEDEPAISVMSPLEIRPLQAAE
jgi:hypothetical protein